MDTRQCLDIARASVEAFNARDWNRFKSLLAPNGVYDEVATGRRMTGRDEIVEAVRGWTTAFPDAEGTIERATVTQDTVVLEITYRGTHQGELSGPGGTIAPTGRSMVTRAAEVFRISDGLIVENCNYFDMLGMMQALGAIPAEGAQEAGT